MGQRVVAVCADAVPPASGDAFSECTQVVWVSDVTQLTQEDIAELWPAVLLFFASIFVWRTLRKVL